ncbi:MAG: D-alanine--D-alanine ligase [Planctomycetota bacterium]|jgi:D-alanine-D-alanine ligase|nr:D-alanine--D-alanine ligase [Planctomycetota bacterium]
MLKSNPLRRVFFAYDAAAPDGGVAAADVLQQLATLRPVLAATGLDCRELAVGLDFHSLREQLGEPGESLVFNLVESLAGLDRLQTVFVMFLESWGVPFTGSGSAALYLSNHKLLAKQQLDGVVPLSPSCHLDRTGQGVFTPPDCLVAGQWLTKPVECHASLHMDDNSLLSVTTPEELVERLRSLEQRHGCPFFAEHFIGGREFNVSLVEDREKGEVVVLPPAEINFTGLAAGKPRIVGFAAKWEEDSPEYLATPRFFPDLAGEAGLARELREYSLAAWRCLDLAGYARVDFRVDSTGRPYFLEANTNPCLSPDAGFLAAVARAGWSVSDLCQRIVRAAGVDWPN